MTYDFIDALSKYCDYYCYCGIGCCFFKMPQYIKRIDYMVRDIIRVQNILYIDSITNGQDNAHSKGGNKDWGSNGFFHADGSICPKYILKEGNNKTFDYTTVDEYYKYMKRETKHILDWK